MAIRPVFIPADTQRACVKEAEVDFTWHPGLSRQQKQKSIRALHDAAKRKFGLKRILEISSKSELQIGRDLSAFNLCTTVGNNIETSVECAFQGSKVFSGGGPYADLYYVSALDAKRDARLKSSGELMSFHVNGRSWPLEPLTLFYDWLYLNALRSNKALANKILNFDGFTDIEFNPKKSINCQARSAALYVQLYKTHILRDVLKSQNTFTRFMTARDHAESTANGEQIDLFL